MCFAAWYGAALHQGSKKTWPDRVNQRTPTHPTTHSPCTAIQQLYYRRCMQQRWQTQAMCSCWGFHFFNISCHNRDRPTPSPGGLTKQLYPGGLLSTPPARRAWALMTPVLSTITPWARVARPCDRGGSSGARSRWSSAGHTETGVVGTSNLDITTTAQH